MDIAVSACLLGTPCRFDGAARLCEEVAALGAHHALVPVCPEVAGGLPVPHPPCEIVAAEQALRVVDAEGADVTDAFLQGAARTLGRVQKAGCTLAVLKAKSPSCGSGSVYDGTFSGTLVPGCGVAARALRAAGVRVVDEMRLRACLEASERRRSGQAAPLLAGTAAECPVLETARLVLRPLAADDIADVFAYCSDPGIGADAGWPPHRTLEDSRAFVEQVACAPHVFGIFEKTEAAAAAGGEGFAGWGASDAGPCIGSVGLIPDPQRRNVDCLMLGYALARAAWGRGLMTEAAREVVRYGFEELGLDMATCTRYPSNVRSRRVIEKCGFVHEGTLHGAEAGIDGCTRDLESYCLLRERWEELEGICL